MSHQVAPRLTAFFLGEKRIYFREKYLFSAMLFFILIHQ